MKTISKLMLTVTVLCAAYLPANSQSGIYISAADFTTNKLSYEGCRLHLHDFFYQSPNVTVTRGSKKLTYKKITLYGFRNKDGAYRFYNNIAYRIAEAGDIYLYTVPENRTNGKGFTVVNRYYFSTTPDVAVLPLTLANLQRAYSKNDAFLDLMEIYLSNGDVTAYDHIHKTYKVNYLLRKANKKR